jgi:hypothetical protein
MQKITFETLSRCKQFTLYCSKTNEEIHCEKRNSTGSQFHAVRKENGMSKGSCTLYVISAQQALMLNIREVRATGRYINIEDCQIVMFLL